jgi:signal transduction histidine kinase/PAS domain-containing protein
LVTGVPISPKAAPGPTTRRLIVPADLQRRVRRMLHDPTAELLIWCGSPVWAYSDVEGRRRELDAEGPGRVVTPVERDGSRLAAIVHAPVRPEDADVVEQVAAAVGLEVERDRFLFELERSEQRSRALLDALPDKMFRIRTDGVILDIHENVELSTTPTDVLVGSSVYDAPVPREVVDHVMASGKLALDSGTLQTFEWQRRVVGDLRHLEGRFIPSGDDEFMVVVRDVTDRKRHEVEQQALHRVAVAVAAEGRPERIFDLVAEEVARVLEAHSSNLLRYDDDGSGSVIVGCWSEPGVFAGPIGHRFPMQDGTPAQRVYTTGLPVRIDLEDGACGEFADHMRRIGANSVVAAPIIVTGRIWGVITARLTPPHLFPDSAKKRISKFARLVSLALANEEAREQLAASRARLLSTADEERRRLERNLHDGAQQRLVSLALTLRQARSTLAFDPESANELLVHASAELDVALEELRELARGIHPAVLTNRGLEPALRMLADRSTIPVDIELLAEGRLPARVEAAAYYLVSESLTNVAKYAGASAVKVRVAQGNGSATVEVADNGIGGADPERGSGLRGLIDRIEALEGTLTVDSPPGEGTTIRAAIPG